MAAKRSKKNFWGGGVHGSFEEVFLEALDEGLLCLGESGRQAVYFHVERLFGIKKGEIPFRVKDFADALEKIFGPGARLVEIQIMKSLYRRVKAPLGFYRKPQNLSFAEYVDAVRKGFIEKEKRKAKDV